MAALPPWGANMFSMAIVGPLVAWLVFRSLNSTGNTRLAVFAAAALADLATYVVTAGQLALAFPAASGGFSASFLKFGSIFAITQLPLAITEGLLTVLVWNWLQNYGQRELTTLQQLARRPETMTNPKPNNGRSTTGCWWPACWP